MPHPHQKKRSSSSAFAAIRFLLAVIASSPSFAVADDDTRAESFRFDYDIAPILARHGCAAADCHGGATGRANFKLSLFATDARSDYRAITQDLDGRRIDFVQPSASLLLKKPTRQLKHGGGKIFSPEDADYQTLENWIRSKAPHTRGPSRQLESLSLAGLDEDRLRVEAHFRYGDGRQETRDVTGLARFDSTNGLTAVVNDLGEVERKAPGIAWLTASYADLSQRLALIIPFPSTRRDDDPPGPQASLSTAQTFTHPLDRSWLSALQSLELSPAPPAGPRTLARRLYLDLAGRIPSPEEVDAFLVAPPEKRVALTADQLLQEPEFVDAMAPHLWEWFEVPSPGMDSGPRQSTYQNLRQVLRAWLSDAGSFDALVERVLATAGGPFLQRFEDPRDRSEYVGKTLLGLSIGCARCHNHPLDRWRQDDHLRFSAYFASPRPNPNQPGAMMDGKFFLPGEQQAVEPALLPIGKNIPTANERSSQDLLSTWVLSSGREAFDRNLANRAFGWLLGRFLVDPADDHRLTNPALHESMLVSLVQANPETLAELIRFIVTSQVYQVTSALSENRSLASDPERHYLARRDAVPLSRTQRAASIEQALGIPIRLTPSGESPLAQQLADLNDGQLLTALSQPGNALEALMLFESDPAERLSALFQLILNRPPNDDERAAFTATMRHEDDARHLAFALFSSREFGSKR